MTGKNRITACSMSVIFAGAVFCYFRFVCTYHIHYQEQFQLFEFTWKYLADTISVPGGLSDWVGRFLTQFYYYAVAGAAIVAALATAIQLLTYRAIGKDSLLSYALCFVPAGLACIFLSDESALAGAAVALVLSLTVGVAVNRIPAGRARTAVKLAAVPLIYFLAGPAALAYVAVAFCKEKVLLAAASAALLALCPVISERIWQLPPARLFCGVHYYRFTGIVPVVFWIAVLSSCILVVAGNYVHSRKQRSGFTAGIILFVIVSAASGVGLRASFDSAKEEVMKYDFLTYHRMWNNTMMAADVKNPSTPLSVSCLNLALAMSGRMPGAMFEYYQNGPEGLLPSFNRESTTAMSTSDIYYHLGMINTAQRLAFEAQESIPDFQKSARCYKMLCMTNLINGDYDVAAKYLESLKHTLFYSDWARKTAPLLYNEEAIRAVPEYARMRIIRFESKDFLFSDEEMDSMLGLLHLENRTNQHALDYLLAWTLLKKDLDRFMECLYLITDRIMPRSYQEAFVLKWALDGQKETLPGGISRQTYDLFTKFVADQQSGTGETRMQKKYGDTYWFYYFYRY